MSEDLPPGTAPGTVQVGGDGSVSSPPDLARVRLAGTALRPTVLDAMAAADGAVRRIRRAVGGLGIPAADAATRTISVAMEQDWSDKTPRTTGFRAEHALTLTVREIDRLGEVMGAALAAGGDDVRLDGVEFAIADDSGLRGRAREAAWADAAARAEQLARLAGRRLGPVLDVVEGVPGPGGVRPLAMAARAAAVDVEPGSMDVEVRLTVRWALA
jgi:uncharacterized protein YggE